MLKRGVIQHSNSPYSAPIVLARMKDGSWRFCVHYRRLNEITVKVAFPIPKTDQTFDALNGAKLFSTLDLASGYWQVPVAPEDRHKTAFVNPDGGFYEYVRMPFGLTNAPGTFQRTTDEHLVCPVYLQRSPDLPRRRPLVQWGRGAAHAELENYLCDPEGSEPSAETQEVQVFPKAGRLLGTHYPN